MEIVVSVSPVDGQTVKFLRCKGQKEALAFLKQHDHEGAIIVVTVTGKGEYAYELLDLPLGGA